MPNCFVFLLSVPGNMFVLFCRLLFLSIRKDGSLTRAFFLNLKTFQAEIVMLQKQIRTNTVRHREQKVYDDLADSPYLFPHTLLAAPKRKSRLRLREENTVQRRVSSSRAYLPLE